MTARWPRAVRRAAAALPVLVLAAVTAVAATAAPARAQAGDPEAGGRVLVIALPGVTWADIEAADLPNLDTVLEGAALANLAVRVDRLRTLPGSGYATIGSGTKTVAPDEVAGLALGPQEPYENSTAAEVFRRRTGAPLAGAAGHLRLGTLEQVNDASVYGGRVGFLGDALRAAGVSRGVVANADRSSLHGTIDEYHREAVLSLMDSGGIVPCGQVDKDLLADEPDLAFGLGLSPAAVREAVARCWRRGGVVLVEGSDLARAAAYRSTVTPAHRPAALRRALEHTDAVLAGPLSLVDPERDAVVVVAPSGAADGPPRLAAFAVAAPGLAPGLLQSASTRQPGYVAIVDVAPTIAELAGVELDVAEIDGRAATWAGRGGDGVDERIDRLIAHDLDAQFRDRVIAPTVATFITLEALLTLAAIALLWRNRRIPRALGGAALGLMASLPLTYLAAMFPFRDWGTAAYFAFVFGGGLALGFAADSLRPLLAPLAAIFGLMLATITVSVVALGSRLQLSTVFGDSPIVAGRFSGVNNVTFAQVMVASLLLGVIVVHRRPGRPGRTLMLGLFAATLVMLGAPMWGADVGGVLAGVPAFLVAATLLAGWRIRWRSVVLFGGVTLAAIVALGFLDLTRDPSSRSHLGRLFERVGADGWDGFETVVRRKLTQNLRTLTNSAWRFVLLPVLALAAFFGWRSPGRIRAIQERVPELRAGLLGIAVAGGLGYALNDSGIAVPGMMLAVLVLAALHLLARLESPASTEVAPGHEDAGERVPAEVGG
jgi:hypothetical protein